MRLITITKTKGYREGSLAKCYWFDLEDAPVVDFPTVAATPTHGVLIVTSYEDDHQFGLTHIRSFIILGHDKLGAGMWSSVFDITDDPSVLNMASLPPDLLELIWEQNRVEALEKLK